MTDGPSRETTSDGITGRFVGRVKEALGEFKDDEQLAREGKLQRAKAEASQEAADAAGDAELARREAELKEERAEVEQEHAELQADLTAQERETEADRQRIAEEAEAERDSAEEIAEVEDDRRRQLAIAAQENVKPSRPGEKARRAPSCSSARPTPPKPRRTTRRNR